MKTIISLFFTFFPLGVLAVTSASSLKLKIYQVSVSASTDCSSPITILSSSSGTETDFMTDPVIGSGSVPDGTYPCMMITMDDVIKYKPLANDLPGCTAGTEYTADLCRDLASTGAGQERYSFTDLLIGTTFTPDVECQGTDRSLTTGGIANKVTLYLRTTAPTVGSPEEDDVNSWKKGTALANSVSGGNPSVDTDHGINLASPFVVSGSIVGVFYAETTNLVQNNGGDCELNGVLFGFRDP